MRLTAREAALSSGLALMLPEESQTKFLRAALFRGAAGVRALAEVAPDLAKPQRLTAAQRVAVRTLSPLLESATADTACAHRLGADAIKVLRIAAARERVRYDTVRRLTGGLLAAFADRGIEATLLRGLVLAETVYPEPFRRHTHDIDVYVPPADLGRAIEAAHVAGFAERVDDPDRLPGGVRLVHPSGFPVELHTSLFLDPFYPAVLEGMSGRLRHEQLFGTRTSVLGTADQLVHVCGNAAHSPVRGSLRWAADAWLLIDSDPALDWNVVTLHAEFAQLALPLSVMLRYLTDELQSPVPTDVLERLDASARTASPIARDVALYGARAGLPALSLVRRAPAGIVPRLWALRWLLFPSPTYLRHAYRGRRVPLGLLYPYRIWHHAVAGLRGRLRRVRMPGSLEAEIA